MGAVHPLAATRLLHRLGAAYVLTQDGVGINLTPVVKPVRITVKQYMLSHFVVE